MSRNAQPVKFTPLASSSSGNLYIAEEGGSRISIECGVSFSRMKTLLSHRVSSLASCIVSHAHQDHCKCAPDLAAWGVPILASREALDLMDLPTGSQQRVLEDKVPMSLDGGWRLLPFAVPHEGGAMNFLLEAPSGDRLLYACDAAYSPYRFEGLTHVAVEANHSVELVAAGSAEPARVRRVLHSHMSIEAACALLRANDLSKVREVHLLHLSDGHSDAEAFADMARRASGRPVYVAPARTW